MPIPADPSRQTSAAVMTGRPCFVRVTGTLDARFVQFEFAIGDPELSVDLVMQFDQFREFCERHGVTHLSAEEGARLDYERLKWRYGQPGVDH